jgi:hypothetical protein
MLEIWPARECFVGFDTKKQVPVMRFDNMADKEELVAQVAIAETCEQPQEMAVASSAAPVYLVRWLTEQ